MPKFKPTRPDWDLLTAEAEKQADQVWDSIIAKTISLAGTPAPEKDAPSIKPLWNDLCGALLNDLENADIQRQVDAAVKPYMERRDNLIGDLHQCREEVKALQAERKTALQNGEKPSPETVGSIIALTGDAEVYEQLIREVTDEINDFRLPEMNNHLQGVRGRVHTTTKALARQIFQHYADALEVALIRMWGEQAANSPLPVIHLSRPMRAIAEGRPVNVAVELLNG